MPKRRTIVFTLSAQRLLAFVFSPRALSFGIGARSTSFAFKSRNVAFSGWEPSP
jgi:hypothetical protein